MNKTVLLWAFFFCQLSLVAQPNKKPAPLTIPMTAAKWGYTPGSCTFLTYKSVAALQLLGSKDTAVVKDLRFTNGTIDYDVEPQDSNFTGFFFRRQDSRECEYFYLRVFAAGIPNEMAAVQYAPVIGGVNLWNLLPHDQGPATFAHGQWNHVRLVVSGAQMLVYVNDLHRPALEIAQLEGNTTAGTIGFDGKAVISNLIVTPDATDGLSPVAGFDPFYNDPRYLRQWMVSEPIPLPPGHEPTKADLPRQDVRWAKIEAERRGLVNLTRLYGKSDTRRLVWLKCRLKTPVAQSHRVDFGFNNEVWIYVNGKLAAADKNLYGELIQKPPRARCSTENSFFELPLQAGTNELLIGVANNFYGWGIIARLDDITGIEVVNE